MSAEVGKMGDKAMSSCTGAMSACDTAIVTMVFLGSYLKLSRRGTQGGKRVA